MTTDQDHAVEAAEPAVRCAAGDYGTFLRLDLLAAATREVPEHPDGRFFVLVHQAFEIWFELIVHELVGARADLFAGAVPDALYRLRRVASVDRLLVAQLDTLTTISPGSFVSLRPHLGTASGFQSVRFREIEYLCGLRARGHTAITAAGGVDRARLDRRRREPSLGDAFRDLLRRRGITDPALLLRTGRPAGDVLEVAETLLDHDEAWALWRMRHTLAVERIIGRKSGTGGSSGVDYLRSRHDERFFPELWELRTAL